MPVLNRHKQLLARIGVTTENYFIDGWPPVWGVALIKNGKEIAVIESHGDHTEEDKLRNKYMLRDKRSIAKGAKIKEPAYRGGGFTPTVPGRTIEVRKTQRECIAAATRMIVRGVL